jgi:DNA primase
MQVDFDSFVEWCEDRFNGDVVVKGKEVRINSIFTDDDNHHHLWCSPSGGKHHRDYGVFHCFKTDKKGTLIGLIMEVDNCSYDEAKEILTGATSVRDLEDLLDEFFKKKEEEIEKVEQAKLQLPPSFLITDLSKTNFLRLQSESYLLARKLPIEGFYIGIDDDYGNRIIIPYYDSAGKLIYFNSRALNDNGLRYLGPKKDLGVGKLDVIYVPQWPAKGSRIYLTEGEFDALTLYICGFNAAACGGKTLGEKQIDYLRGYNICLALDEDAAGFSGIIEMGKKLIANQFSDITFVRPPKGLKDWNKMLKLFKAEIIQAWIHENEKKFDEWTPDVLLL